MNSFRSLVGLLALMLVGILLGASLYESVVLVPNFRHDIPNSLEHFRLFMRAANPGTFFRVVAPMTQVTLLVGVIIFWMIRPARWWFVAALVTCAAGDVMTFTFHYPRNHLLFRSPLTQPVTDLTVAAQEWGDGNIVRVLMVAVGLICVAWGLRNALMQRAQTSSV
jgi:hypothetical protein